MFVRLSIIFPPQQLLGHRFVLCSLLLLFGVFSTGSLCAVESSWVKTGGTGRLIYVPDAEGDRILDFSGAGYQGQGLNAIPEDVPNVITLSPIGGDDTASIQNAINQIAAMPLQSNGYRGAVLLQAGDYDINSQLNINASGIVLRGVGRETNGTVLHGRGTSQRSLINVKGSGGLSGVGSTRNLIDKVVPAGSRSFRVDVPGEFSIGDKVRVTRPGTQAWIDAIGMNNPPNGDPPWTVNQSELIYDRVVTRVEGDRVFVDAPLPQSFEQQYGGGTIRRYSWNGAIENVGIENLRGDSDYTSDTAENHAWEFVSVGVSHTSSRAENVWIRDITSIHFGDSSVVANPGSKWVTVDNAINLDPKSIITGGRRYSFDLSGEFGLIANSQADQGRHDFVNNSTHPKGPNVFYNSYSTNANSDTGPHQRWATGTLFDNISVQGHDINIRNRGSYGTSHGWSGANMVAWNSSADSFRVQNPPTSQNWLVGSTGPIVEDTTFGFQPSGYYDSHGTPVTTGGTTSLYEAQVNDARDVREFHWEGGSGTWGNSTGWAEQLAPDSVYEIDLRDYLIGDIDQFVHDGSGSVDEAYIDSSWQSYIQGISTDPITGFDDLSGNQNVAFTIQHQLGAGEQVVHGFVAFGFREGVGQTDTDYVRLFDGNPSHKFDFSSLGWNSEINSSSTFVGVLDLGPYLNELQSGSVNVQVSDDTGVDWAIYTVAVAVPVVDSVGPSVFIESGGNVIVDSIVGPVASLSMQGLTPSTLTLQSDGKVNVSGDIILSDFSELAVELAGATVGAFGEIASLGNASLDGTLDISLDFGFTPVAGDVFQIITAENVVGTFDSLTLPMLAEGLAWGVEYASDSVSLSVLFAADFDGDGMVDSDDLVTWQSNYGSTSALHSTGDADGDGDVDGADFLSWQRQLGSQSNASSAVAVPEPASLTLLLLSLLFGKVRLSRS